MRNNVPRVESDGKITTMSKLKRATLQIFDDVTSPFFRPVNFVLAGATIVSLLTIVLRSIPSLSPYTTFFRAFEIAIVALFCAEYLLRLWAAPRRIQYVRSFYGIIDLASILPSFFALGNLTLLKSARFVRFTRLFRLASVSKLSHQEFTKTHESVRTYGTTILRLMLVLLSTFLISGIALAYIDRSLHPLAGAHWVLTVFLGTDSDVVPSHALGTAVYVFARFSGMLLLGVSIGVIGKLFNEWILGKK